MAERNIKLVLEYDGTDYCGWQTQENGPTVQETLEKAIEQAGDTELARQARAWLDELRGRNAHQQVSWLKQGPPPENPDEVRALHRSIRGVLRQAIQNAGTTFQNYRAVNGRSGSFQTRLNVYGREGEGCRKCRGSIERIVQAGRSTYFCAGCQR